MNAPVINLEQPVTVGQMMAQSRRWLLYKLISKGEGKKPAKVPVYTNGCFRGVLPDASHVALDSAEDIHHLATYDDAQRVLSMGDYAGLGFALGPDGTGNCWQGIDFDGVSSKPQLVVLSDQMTGYRETSPSGNGYHWIGYGAPFENLPPFQGIEAYSSARFFTVTMDHAMDCEVVDLSAVVAQHLAPLRPPSNPKPKGNMFASVVKENCSLEQLKSMYDRIPVSKLRELDWRNIMMGTHHQFAGTPDAEAAFDLFNEWSKGGIVDGEYVPDPRYSAREIATRWRSFGRNPHLCAPGAARTIKTVRAEAEKFTPFDMKEAARKAAEQLPKASPAAFGAMGVREFLTAPRKHGYLIKGILPDQGLAQIYGDSGVGKTFEVIDMMLAIAQGAPWRGHRVRQGNIIYVAAEGASGVRKRLQAYAKHHGVDVEWLNIIVLTVAPNIMEDEQFQQLGTCIASAGDVDLIVIDTLAQTMGGGNENSSEGMGLAIARYTQLASALDTTVLLVHHSGKDPSLGARGWSGQKGAMDAQFEVTMGANGLRATKVTKAKDGVIGTVYPFRLQVVPLGIDEDGDEITSCVSVPAGALPDSGGQPEQRESDSRLRGDWQKRVMRHIAIPLAMGVPLDHNEVVAAVCDAVAPDPGVKRDRRRNNITRAINELADKNVISIAGNTIIAFDPANRKPVMPYTPDDDLPEGGRK